MSNNSYESTGSDSEEYDTPVLRTLPPKRPRPQSMMQPVYQEVDHTIRMLSGPIIKKAQECTIASPVEVLEDVDRTVEEFGSMPVATQATQKVAAEQKSEDMHEPVKQRAGAGEQVPASASTKLLSENCAKKKDSKLAATV